MAIKFGTDGWRGIMGEDFTFANVRLCTLGVSSYVKGAGLAERGLLVAYDTRFASENFAAAAAEVLAATGVKALLCPRPTPTPVASYGIVARHLGGAIIITASHNPAIWNGFKYKSEYAGTASPEITAQIEQNISRFSSQEIPSLPLEQALEKGIVEYYDPAPAYNEHLSSLVNLDKLRHAGFPVVADGMFGTGSGYLPSLLSGGSTRVLEIHAERNPLFPGLRNPEPIAQNLASLSRVVRQRKAAVGLALDGDADRLGVVDEKGRFLTPLQVFALIALYFLEVRQERGPIVKSLTTSRMLFKLGKLYGVPIVETPIGFKHIAPKMLAENALLGGEESGGYGFRGHIPERDGILAALYFLDLMDSSKLTPSQLLEYLYRKVGPHYYDRVDLELPPAKREELSHLLESLNPKEVEGASVVETDRRDGLRFLLSDESWLLLRISGTEPLVRIYAESSSLERVQRLIAQGRKWLGL